MPASRLLYEDVWGDIIDRLALGLMEIRWFDSTESMSAEEFKAWLTRFASALVENPRGAVLVDATRFAMPANRMDAGWRENHIYPKYHQSGLKKFAFIMPPTMPLIGQPPAREGTAQFLTGYFGKRADAVAWLREVPRQ